MIELSYKDLNNTGFQTALSGLSKKTNFREFKTAYWLARIVKKVLSETKTAGELFVKFRDEYYTTDTEGKQIVKEGKQEELDKKMEEFLGMKIELPFHKIKMDALEGVGVSPADLVLLEPILEDNMEEEA